MAVKKAQAQNKAVSTSVETAGPGMVSVTVGAGPIHYGGKRYAPGDTVEMPEQVAAALVGAKLVAKAGGG
jgi:hypothetical protein